MNARDAALIRLDAKQLPGWRGGILSPKRTRKNDAPDNPRDRALAEQIEIGVVKNLLLLQFLTEHFSGRKLKSIDPLAQKILAIALYQLGFLERVPASAAVDEAVEQAKRFGRGRASGFVNAVLRKATRQPDVALPNAATHPAEHARIALSHPPELFARLAAQFGADDALQFCRHDNTEPPTIVRAFEGVEPEKLHAPGVTLTPHERPRMYVVEPAKVSTLAGWAAAGLAQAQDPTAARVAEDCDLRPGQTVLDRCCGLGTKTMQLRERVGDGGLVFAVDPSARRCEGLRKLCAARGISNVGVIQTPLLAPVARELPKTFDRVLVDVPCSNSGVLPRRPEARYAQDKRSLDSLARLQREILNDTAPWISPGGLMIYSTCSVWREENEDQVEAFVRTHPEFEKLSERSTRPSFDTTDPTRYHDGGYVAVLRRRAPQ